MNIAIEESWKQVLENEFEAEYFRELTQKVRGEYLSGTHVYPPPKSVFRAFELCPFDAVTVQYMDSTMNVLTDKGIKAYRICKFFMVY